MKHTTTINGRVFEVKRVHRTYDELAAIAWRGDKSIWEAYGRPSLAKQRIYNDWKEWGYMAKGLFYFGVYTHSCQLFTMIGIIEEQPIISNETGEILTEGYSVVRITPTHNYLEIVY